MMVMMNTAQQLGQETEYCMGRSGDAHIQRSAPFLLTNELKSNAANLLNAHGSSFRARVY